MGGSMSRSHASRVHASVFFQPGSLYETRILTTFPYWTEVHDGYEFRDLMTLSKGSRLLSLGMVQSRTNQLAKVLLENGQLVFLTEHVYPTTFLKMTMV